MAAVVSPACRSAVGHAEPVQQHRLNDAGQTYSVPHPECLPTLFEGFNDNCVLVHGNFTLRSMLKDSRSDQLLAMVGPGIMLWAPREYELFRLSEGRGGGRFALALSSARPVAGGLSLATLALSSLG